MRRALRGRERRALDERGMTLVELLVAMAIMSIVMLVMTTTLTSIQRAVVEEDVRGRLNDQARLAMQSLDRLVRSGNILYDPVDETGNDPYDVTAAGYLFRVYTQAEQAEDEDPRCALWLVNDDQQLLYRTWPVLDPDAATDATLDTLTVSCSKTQAVGASTVTWRVTIASGGVLHATTTTAQTQDPTDPNIRWDVQAVAQPIEITIRYEFIVDGVTEVDLTATFDPGELLARGIYEPPPAQQGV